jgi:hypothetical protein
MSGFLRYTHEGLTASNCKFRHHHYRHRAVYCLALLHSIREDHYSNPGRKSQVSSLSQFPKFLYDTHVSGILEHAMNKMRDF